MSSQPVIPAPSGPGRHEARERAIALLYEAESKGIDGPALLATLPLEPDRYAVAAIEGIDADQNEIDRIIAERAIGWQFDRLPRVDRAILRLGVWELRSRPDVPVAVVIDEAVELAKEYSTEKSSSFVNGILDAVAADARSG